MLLWEEVDCRASRHERGGHRQEDSQLNVAWNRVSQQPASSPKVDGGGLMGATHEIVSNAPAR